MNAWSVQLRQPCARYARSSPTTAAFQRNFSFFSCFVSAEMWVGLHGGWVQRVPWIFRFSLPILNPVVPVQRTCLCRGMMLARARARVAAWVADGQNEALARLAHCDSLTWYRRKCVYISACVSVLCSTDLFFGGLLGLHVWPWEQDRVLPVYCDVDRVCLIPALPVHPHPPPFIVRVWMHAQACTHQRRHAQIHIVQTETDTFSHACIGMHTCRHHATPPPQHTLLF